MSEKSKIVPPDHEQRELIDRELGVNLLVEAAAGTGKTTKMVDRLTALVRSGTARIDSIAAVTFTRKAAGELRSRFQLELERRVREDSGPAADTSVLREALEHLDRCFIGTIHSFCARLLRERPVEAGVDPDFREIDEEQEDQLRERVWQEYIAALYAGDSPLLEELERLGIEPGALEPAFRLLCLYPDVEDWPAPALDPPESELCLRELTAYAEHMRSLAPALPEDPGRDGLIPAYGLIPRLAGQLDLADNARLAEVLAEFKAKTIVQKEWPGGGKQAKEELERWDFFRAQHAEPFLERWRACCYAPALSLVRDAAAFYQQRRTGLGLLNYADLLLKARALLRDHPNVREYFSRRWTHLLVDEFQDTDPVQAEVLLLLAATGSGEKDWQKCVPRPGALFVVGDPKQSIYRFRRADIVTYDQVKRIILANGGRMVRLSANFRSEPGLLDWVNRTFSDKFVPGRYSPDYVALEAAGRDGAAAPAACVRLLNVPADYDTKEKIGAFEPKFVARLIREVLDGRSELFDKGRPPEETDFLVLAYGRKNLERYAAALEELGVAHQVTGSGALGGVRQLWLLYLCLSALTRPEDPLPLVALLRSALFGISDSELYLFRRAGGKFSFRGALPEGLEPGSAARFRDVFQKLTRYTGWLARFSQPAAVERIAGDLGLFASAAADPGGNQAAGGLAKALELLRAAAGVNWTLSETVAYLGRLARGEAPFDSLPASPGARPLVRVMNLHQVKGLEAGVVFLADPTGEAVHPPQVHVDRSSGKACGYLEVRSAGPGRSTALIARPQDWPHWLEEEGKFGEAERLRLFYVAATRAKSRLVISQRMKSNHNNPWKFFQESLGDCPEASYPGPPEPRRIETKAERTEIEELPFEQLRQAWRTAAEPGYSLEQARQAALEGRESHSGGGEHGTEWGSVIHRLLQAAMEQPGLDLSRWVAGMLKEEELDPGLSEMALEVVGKVGRSEIWRRAVAAELRLVEAPFEFAGTASGAESESGARIIRGVVDLAFREQGRWVIVDYKTDREARGDLERLTAYYAPQLKLYAEAWRLAAGESVGGAGLYFTAIDRYVTVEL